MTKKEMQEKLKELYATLHTAEKDLITEKLKDTSVLHKTRKGIARILTNLKQGANND